MKHLLFYLALALVCFYFSYNDFNKFLGTYCIRQLHAL